MMGNIQKAHHIKMWCATLVWLSGFCSSRGVGLFDRIFVVVGGVVVGGVGGADVPFGGDAVLDETLGGGEDVATPLAETVHGLVVGRGGVAQVAPHGVHAVAEEDDLVVEAGGGLHDAVEVLDLVVAAPEVEGETQGGDEVGGGDDDYLALVGVVPEVGVGLGGEVVGGLVGDEHHDEVGGLLAVLGIVD